MAESFCGSCIDRVRGSDDCALIPRLPAAWLAIKAAVQTIDERQPMMPSEAVALDLKYEEGNTPRQLLVRYKKDVGICIDAHKVAPYSP